MNRGFILAITFSLWIGLHISASPISARGQIDLPRDTDQGVNAENVESVVINNNFARARNADRERLGSLMIRMLQQANLALEGINGFKAYTILQDSRDPFFSARNGRNVSHDFIAGDAFIINAGHWAMAPRCQIQPGIFLVGRKHTGRVGDEVETRTQFLSRDDGLLNALCSSLGRSASVTSPSNTHTGEQGELTNFDVFVDGEEFIVFVFMPGEMNGITIETSSIRDFWIPAVTPVNVFNIDEEYSRALIRERGRASVAALANESRRTGRLDTSVRLDSLGLSNSIEGQRRQAIDEFGQPFEDLETSWISYLQVASLTVSGHRLQAAILNQPRPLLPRFQIAEIGSDRFWAHIEDLNEFSNSVHCLATQFAVDQDYARPRDLPNYASCVSANLRAARSQ